MGDLSTSLGERTLVFVGGLHRSGTTLLARCMAEHPEASGFHDTGVIEDEGQFLQSVYPAAREHGGVGRFGFSEAMHVTEASPMVSAANAQTMFGEWSAHWDMGRAVLIEKSPPNILKTRFLRALFPASAIVMCVRHPVAVALASSKWTRRWPLDRHIEHWVRCHEILRGDLARAERVKVVAYESFVSDPNGVLARIDSMLGIDAHDTGFEVRGGINSSYFARWNELTARAFAGRRARRAIATYEDRVRTMGYSLEDLDLQDVEGCWDSGED